MRTVIATLAMMLFAGCAGIPEAKRAEIAPAAPAQLPTVCRRTTVRIDGQYEVVMVCRPVQNVPPDAYDKVPKSKI